MDPREAQLAVVVGRRPVRSTASGRRSSVLIEEVAAAGEVETVRLVLLALPADARRRGRRVPPTARRASPACFASTAGVRKAASRMPVRRRTRVVRAGDHRQQRQRLEPVTVGPGRLLATGRAARSRVGSRRRGSRRTRRGRTRQGDRRQPRRPRRRDRAAASQSRASAAKLARWIDSCGSRGTPFSSAEVVDLLNCFRHRRRQYKRASMAQRPENVPPIDDWNRLLDGRVAVVTGGGADGIGGAIARLFARHGALVEIAEIDADRADADAAGDRGRMAATVANARRRCHRPRCRDGRSPTTCSARHGRVDVLVNNVGDYRPLVRFRRVVARVVAGDVRGEPAPRVLRHPRIHRRR